MKPLLNTLFVTTDGVYLSLDGENIVVLKDQAALARFPLHNFEQITTFSYLGASPALMKKCADMNIALNFMSPQGRFRRGSLVRATATFSFEKSSIADLTAKKSVCLWRGPLF